MTKGTRASFVIRIVDDGHGRVSGVIERVATGAKESFSGTERIGEVIEGMLGRERISPRHVNPPSRTRGETGCATGSS
jgi:hypothetical protein